MDHVRSHPLFYSQQYNWIGDSIESLQNKHPLKINALSALEFKSARYITGKTPYAKMQIKFKRENIL